MPSVFGWLDYSERERRKVLDLLAAFQERDTRDELGIGTVRDVFADLFFPGTSTIQTRARYFLFVPWIYLDLERRRVPSQEIAVKARRAELDLIEALARSGDSDGTIGIEARRALKRLPSAIYWQGLGTWGIRIFRGGQEQYHRWTDAFYRQKTKGPEWDDDGEPMDGAFRRHWHPGLPPPPKNFPQTASFALSRQEAGYLRERILARVPGTLLVFLVDRGRLWDSVDFPWQHPQWGDFPSRIREQLEHARNFSEVIWGGALLYNLMLAEARDHQELIDDYLQRLMDWGALLDARASAHAQWDHRQFWEIACSASGRIPTPTRLFVEAWLDVATSLKGHDIARDDHARRLIQQRERALKGNLARLENRRALEMWGGDAGTAQLTYRWPVAQRIIKDVLQGLRRGDTRA